MGPSLFGGVLEPVDVAPCFDFLGGSFVGIPGGLQVLDFLTAEAHGETPFLVSPCSTECPVSQLSDMPIVNGVEKWCALMAFSSQPQS